MKRKLIAWILVMVMALSMSGCSMLQERLGRGQRTEEDASADEDSEASDDEDAADAESVAADAEDEVTEEEVAVDETPIFGDGNADYDGFKYLYAEELQTASVKNEESGKMESEKLVVYIPMGDYVNVSRDSAYSDELGVDFSVSLNPYELPYDYEDRTVVENLEGIFEYEYDEYFMVNYKAFEMSDIEKIGDDACRAAVSYIEYSEYDEEYNVRFVTYFMKEMSPANMVLVKAEIWDEYTTGKTEELVQELETFYGFDIEWDAAAAEMRLDTFDPEAEGNKMLIGSLIIELPSGWKEDEDLSSYDSPVYAYEGRARNSGSFISVSEEYLYEDASVIRMLTDDEIALYFEVLMAETIEDIEVEVMGETNLGFTVKISGKSDVTGLGELFDIVTYAVFDDSNMYMIMGADLDGTEGADLANLILETAESVY